MVISIFIKIVYQKNIVNIQNILYTEHVLQKQNIKEVLLMKIQAKKMEKVAPTLANTCV